MHVIHTSLQMLVANKGSFFNLLSSSRIDADHPSRHAERSPPEARSGSIAASSPMTGTCTRPEAGPSDGVLVLSRHPHAAPNTTSVPQPEGSEVLQYNDALYYDAIICNPPFFTQGTKPPGSRSKAAARHADVALPFEDLALGVASLLRPPLDSTQEGVGQVHHQLETTDGSHGLPGAVGCSSSTMTPSSFFIVLPTAAAEVFCQEAERHGLFLVRSRFEQPRYQKQTPLLLLLNHRRLPCYGSRQSLLMWRKSGESCVSNTKYPPSWVPQRQSRPWAG